MSLSCCSFVLLSLSRFLSFFVPRPLLLAFFPPPNLPPGRPSTIRTGKPLYREALKRLVADPYVSLSLASPHLLLLMHILSFSPFSVFAASNLFTYNSELLAKQEALVEACEKELVQLKDIAGTGTGFDGRSSVGKLVTGPSAIEMRAESVMGRMKAAQVMSESFFRSFKCRLQFSVEGGKRRWLTLACCLILFFILFFPAHIPLLSSQRTRAAD
jgi:hypothetical protein